jgi:hypothetical protein
MASPFRMTFNSVVALTRLRRGEKRGLELWAEEVLTRSNAKVPLDEGPLEASGRARVKDRAGSISYDTPYAVRQHEDMAYRHAPGREAKYLENALNSTREDGPKLVAEEVRRSMGGRT